MKRLLWFNVIVSVIYLLNCLAVYVWWHFITPRPLLKQLPQQTIESAQSIQDLEQLRKLNLLIIEKDKTNVTQMNDLLETAVGTFASFAQMSLSLFLIGSIWLYQLLRNQSSGQSGDRSSNLPLNPDARKETPRAG